MSAGIIIVLLLVFSVTSQYYSHPMPEKDCSKAYEYPICSRAVAAKGSGGPTFLSYAAGTVLTLVITFILVVLSYHATVIPRSWKVIKDTQKENPKKS